MVTTIQLIHLKEHYTTIPPYIDLLLIESILISRWYVYLSSWELKIHLGFEELDINLMPALREFPRSLEESWETTKTELLQLRQLTSNLGIRLIIAVIPSVQTIQPKAFEHAITYSVFDKEDFDLGKPYRLLEEFANEYGIEVVNPIKWFKSEANKGNTLYLKRDMHFNAAGHSLFARSIADYLLNSL